MMQEITNAIMHDHVQKHQAEATQLDTMSIVAVGADVADIGIAVADVVATATQAGAGAIEVGAGAIEAGAGIAEAGASGILEVLASIF